MIKHIIASGCSFTEDGTGGVPPSDTDPTGGCSYTNNLSDNRPIPNTWVGYVAQQLQVSSLVNLSAGSHGNFLIANNIITLLNLYHYDPTTTVVLFNISDPARLDVPCSWDHPDRSTFCHWSLSIIPYTYFGRNSQINGLMSKNIGIEQIEIASSNALLGMMSFLKKQKINFKFMMMSDYRAHDYLGPILNQFRSHMIELTPGAGMKEFVQNLNLNTGDQFHPDTHGHQRIAEVVLETLSKEL